MGGALNSERREGGDTRGGGFGCSTPSRVKTAVAVVEVGDMMQKDESSQGGGVKRRQSGGGNGRRQSKHKAQSTKHKAQSSPTPRLRVSPLPPPLPAFIHSMALILSLCSSVTYATPAQCQSLQRTALVHSLHFSVNCSRYARGGFTHGRSVARLS